MNQIKDKPSIMLPITGYVTPNNLNTTFYIDTSESTSLLLHEYTKNPISRLNTEKQFVNELLACLTTESKFVEWNNNAKQISDLKSIEPIGGTKPSSIFQGEQNKQLLKETDVLVIITDGSIEKKEMDAFATEIKRLTHLKAIIGVVVGDTTEHRKPSQIDVSVLAPLTIISNSCILFYDYYKIYVMCAEGAFKTLKPYEIKADTNWKDIMKIDFAQLADVRIPIHDKNYEQQLLNNDYIPFGFGNFVSPLRLITYEPTLSELLTYPYGRICKYFKVIQDCEMLIIWYTNQKDRIIGELFSGLEEIILDSEERVQRWHVFFQYMIDKMNDDCVKPTKKSTVQVNRYTTLSMSTSRYGPF